MAFRVEKCDALELIIKITERCNIDCSYCYMFNKGNEDYAARPPYVPQMTISRIISFIVKGIEDLGIKRVSVVLHGGEPLMMQKARFTLLCEQLRTALDPIVKLWIGIQTNATLVDEEWIAILSRFDIDVGISLDGPPKINDKYRIDKKGRGTYSRTRAGIDMLQAAYNAKKITKPGVICVIDPSSSAKEVYRHLVTELGFSNISFNLPMETNDTMTEGFGERCGTYLSELFDEWVIDDDPKIKIRIFDQMLRYFSGDVGMRELLPNYLTKHVMVVIASDGALSEHDDFKVINFAQRAGNVRDTSLYEFANSPLRAYLHHISHTVPDACRSCDWRNYCRAGVTHGLTVSRFSRDNGFNNQSSLCVGFRTLFHAGARLMLRNGLPIEKLTEALQVGEHEASTPIESVRPIPAELFSH